MNPRFYDFAKATVRLIMRVLWRIEVFGSQDVPENGPLIVACNHLSLLDPPAMGCVCPRRIAYMAKKELFTVPVLAPVIRALGAYSVDRKGSATAGVKRSLEVLRAGGAIGIFPEGTRNLDGTVDAQTGVALLASLGGVPVVPACIVGSDRARSFGQIKVAFGAPLILSAGRKATRDDLAKFTGEIMGAIRALAEKMSGDT